MGGYQNTSFMVFLHLIQFYQHAQLFETLSLRLGALLAVGSGWQRMIEAFGIRPDHFVPGQHGPWSTGADPRD